MFKFNTNLSTEELLNYHVEDGFYINGEECSIIFDDSNKDNIIKNYYILNEDIHAKMMNGYTLEENKLLKSICMKFRVCSLNNINWNNESALEEIRVDQYNYLRRVFNINESCISELMCDIKPETHCILCTNSLPPISYLQTMSFISFSAL